MTCPSQGFLANFHKFFHGISRPYTSTQNPKYLVLKKHVEHIILSARIRAENDIQKLMKIDQKTLTQTRRFFSKLAIFDQK